MPEEPYAEARRVRVFPSSDGERWRIAIEQYELVPSPWGDPVMAPVNRAIRTVPDLQFAVSFAMDVAKHEKLQLLIFAGGRHNPPTHTLDYHREG